MVELRDARPALEAAQGPGELVGGVRVGERQRGEAGGGGLEAAGEHHGRRRWSATPRLKHGMEGWTSSTRASPGSSTLSGQVYWRWKSAP